MEKVRCRLYSRLLLERDLSKFYRGEAHPESLDLNPPLRNDQILFGLKFASRNPAFANLLAVRDERKLAPFQIDESSFAGRPASYGLPSTEP